MLKDVMNKKHYLLMLALATLAGFVGGAVANRFFTTQPVFAQKKTKPAKVIEAEEFRLVDKSGNIHVEIKLKEFPECPVKQPVVNLKEHGQDRASLGLSRLGWPHLIFSDANGRPHLSLSLAAIDGKAFPGIDLYTKDGMATLSISPGVGPCLTVSDIYMKAMATLELYPNRNPYLGMRDKDGKLRVSLGLEAKGFPHLTLYDEVGKSRATLGCTKLETTCTGIVEKWPASSLVLFDKEGKVIWSVP